MSRQFLFMTLFALACAAGNTVPRPGDTQRPELDVQLAAPIFFGSGQTAPANLDFAITNGGAVPIKLRRIEVSSSGMLQYALVSTARDYSETIEPGRTKRVTLFATAVANSSRLSPAESLVVRVIADFEANGKRFREIYLNQNAGGS